MGQSFHSISQSLRRDTGIRSVSACVIAVLLVGGWSAWALIARVTRYEVSDSARLEVSAAAYPLDAPLSGELALTRLQLGASVRAGDILAELDSQAEQLSLHEEQIKLSALEPQLAAVRAQVDAEKSGGEEERRVLAVATDGASAQYREAEAQAEAAESANRRAQALRAAGVLAPAEAERAAADAQSKRAQADSLRAAAARLKPELIVRDRDRDLRVRQILEDEAKLEAQIAESRAAIERLNYEIERRRLRAPASGVLSECAVLRPGMHISEGARLGVIVPDGKVHVVAQFRPAAALGKIKPGQIAAVRLDGFPWTRYGVVKAQVSEVAGDVRDGKVRVELAVTSVPKTLPGLTHGLPGSVEVAVDRSSPLSLLLRSAGAN